MALVLPHDNWYVTFPLVVSATPRSTPKLHLTDRSLYDHRLVPPVDISPQFLARQALGARYPVIRHTRTSTDRPNLLHPFIDLLPRLHPSKLSPSSRADIPRVSRFTDPVRRRGGREQRWDGYHAKRGVEGRVHFAGGCGDGRSGENGEVGKGFRGRGKVAERFESCWIAVVERVVLWLCVWVWV